MTNKQQFEFKMAFNQLTMKCSDPMDQMIADERYLNDRDPHGIFGADWFAMQDMLEIVMELPQDEKQVIANTLLDLDMAQEHREVLADIIAGN